MTDDLDFPETIVFLVHRRFPFTSEHFGLTQATGTCIIWLSSSLSPVTTHGDVENLRQRLYPSANYWGIAQPRW